MIKYFLLIFLITVSFKAVIAQDKIENIHISDTLRIKEKVDLYNQQAWKLRNKDVRSGLKYVDKALSLSDSIKYYKGQAAAHNYKGVLYRNLGFYNLALIEYQKAVDIAKQHSIKKELGYGYNNLEFISISGTP